MNCKSVESRLSAYLDGELTGQEMFCLRDHLNQCQKCREEAAELKGLKRLIGSLDCPQPPKGLEERLTAAVMSNRSPKSSFSVYHSAILFAGVAGVTMLATLQVLGSISPTQTEAIRPHQARPVSGIDFEVRRDEMTSSISDPVSGTPVWSAADSR